MSQPGVIQALPPPPHIKQYHQQQQALQQVPASKHSEAIEMRPTTGFTRLPQDLPPGQTQFSPAMEIGLSNGVIRQPPVPEYQSPPTYIRDDNQPNPFAHQHNYEELPVSLPPKTESSTEDIHLQDRQGFHRQGSHTEVDQYYNPPVHSISSTPLTITEPEKKPRKKVNPIYDRYQGPTDKITTSKDGAEKSLKTPGKQRSFPWRCLRHPCTTAFIFVLVAVVIVAVVLILLGTIETPALVGSPEKQVQTTPKTTLSPAGPSQPEVNQELRSLLAEQRRTIELLQTRVETLENMLGGDSEVNASLSAKVAMNTVKVDAIESSVADLTEEIDTIQLTLSGTITNLGLITSRTTALEDDTNMIQAELGGLNAVVVNQGSSIQDIGVTNEQQDMAIATIEQSLSNLDQKFSRELTMVNGSIYGELATISKMSGPRGFNGTDGEQGPQGPAGAGDLSLCTYQMRTDTSSFNYDTFGVWVETPSDKVITGFTCTTTGGTLTDLITSESAGVVSYRCKCSGRTSSTDITSRTCVTHFWDCPRNS